MQVSVEKLSPVLVQLNVEIDAARVTSEYTKAFQTVSRSARIKGFRQGKAPKDIVQRVFGGRIEADLIQRLVDESFPQVVAEQKMQPVTSPSVEPERLSSGKAFTYKAKVEILPVIDSVVYEGLEAKRPSSAVSDADIEEELQSVRRANSTLETPSAARPARDGDVLTVDLRVLVDGELIADAGTNGFSIELGKKAVFDEIEAALVGAELGKTVKASVELPASHPHPKLAGKKADFEIDVKEQKERILPVLDDELAKDLGDFSTLADLRADVQKQLEARKKEISENVLAERLVQALVQANPVPLPPTLVEQQAKLGEREYIYRAAMQGQRVSGVGDALKQQIKDESEIKVRAGLVMAEIAKRENIQIGNEQIEEGLKELATQTGKNVAKLRAEYAEPKRREQLIGMILENKVLDLIEQKAKISDE
ncbi:MAG TPA: trigger factor [Polyangiaceae bacterium]|nr:trigger factor [Polyangiaceae bacterium]